jgi:hypothetical protein
MLMDAEHHWYVMPQLPDLVVLQIPYIIDELLHCLAAKRNILQYGMAYMFIALYTPLF